MTISELYKAIVSINQRTQQYKNVSITLDNGELQFLNDGNISEAHRNEIKYILQIIKKSNVIKSSSEYDSIWRDIKNRINEPKEMAYYHYTDLNGLLGIFKNFIDTKSNDVQNVASCTMRASNIRFLNDSQEYLEGEKKYNWCSKTFNKEIQLYCVDVEQENISPLLNKYLKSKEKEGLKDKPWGDVYSISFCGEGDLLSQWKYYGKQSGIAIKFCFGDKTGFEINGKSGGNSVIPYKVAYDEIDKLVLFAMSCMALDTNDEDNNFLRNAPQRDIFIPFCKNELFREECESRLVFAKTSDVKCEYVVSDGKIKPYIPVTLLAEENKNIIESITVGPGVNQNLVYNALIHIFDSTFKFTEERNKKDLNKNKHRCSNGIIITKSEVPFRG